MAQKVNLDIAQTLNITSRRGDTFNLAITLKDAAGAALPLVTDGYEFVMHVRTSAFADGADGIVLSTAAHVPVGAMGNGIWVGTIENMMVVDEIGNNIDDNGVATIKITDATMRVLPSGRYCYDLQYIASGVHTTILTGSFVVNEDVTEYAVDPTAGLG